MKNTKDLLKGLAVGVALAIGATVLASWSEPTQNPTGGNPEPPLNVSNLGQTKGGNLVVNGSNQYQNGLLVPYGALVVGDANPSTAPGQLKLDVAGKTGSELFCNLAGSKCFSVNNLCQKVPNLCQ